MDTGNDFNPSLAPLYGRPNVEAIVRGAVQQSVNVKRVLVAACGPEGLVIRTRIVVAKLSKIHGPGIDLYVEPFSW
jgi:hypothetical protein